VSRFLVLQGPADTLPGEASPRLRALHDYWRGLAGGGLPHPRQVDPLGLGRLLSHLLLIDPVGDDFRFRLVGEAINARYGGFLKGRCLGELLAGDVLAETLREHALCVETRAAVYARNTEVTAGLADMQVYERLLLPLSQDGVRVDRLLGGMDFGRA
jgi:hypothetical protein